VRIAVLVYELLHRPFLTLARAVTALQCDQPDAVSAVEAAEQTTVDGEPLLRSYKDVFMLGERAAGRVERAGGSPVQLARRGILAYRRAGVERAAEPVRQWLATHDRITSGDYAAMTGTGRPNANRVLNSLVGDLLERGAETRGRNAHFTLRRDAWRQLRCACIRPYPRPSSSGGFPPTAGSLPGPRLRERRSREVRVTPMRLWARRVSR
jgi:ATP-dependent DNA helicase RecG